MPERWEYKIIHIKAGGWTMPKLPNDLNVTFDRYGAEGWELVSANPLDRTAWFRGTETAAVVAFFKRRLQ